jgi:hypothetical protein
LLARNCILFQTASAAESYQILHITQTNGMGGIDYVIADSVDCRENQFGIHAQGL